MQSNLNAVIAIKRKRVSNRGATSRTEGKILTQLLVLQKIDGNLIRFDRRGQGRSNREVTQLARVSDIPFEQRRRYREPLGHGVKAVLARCVCRKKK